MTTAEVYGDILTYMEESSLLIFALIIECSEHWSFRRAGEGKQKQLYVEAKLIPGYTEQWNEFF